jgi:hypothetical protein
MEAMARSASRRGSGGGDGAGALAAAGELFTVNMPVGSGGNPSSERALLKVMPRVSVIIIESMYHGGGVLFVADEPEERLPVVGV